MLNIMRKMFSKKQVKELSKETIESEKSKLNVGWLYKDGDIENVTEVGDENTLLAINIGKYLSNRCVPTSISFTYNGEMIDIAIYPNFETTDDIEIQSQSGNWSIEDWDGDILLLINTSGIVDGDISVISVVITPCYNANYM